MIHIIQNRKIWYAISGAFVAAAVISLGIWRLNFGIDFTGGSLLEVSLPAPAPSAVEISAAFEQIGNPATVQASDGNTFLARFGTVSEARHQEILSELKKRFGEAREERFESIGPTIGGELRRKALIALLVVLVAIAAYVAWAFRKVSDPIASWKYGIITLITLFHDVLIPVGIFSVLGKFGGKEVGAPFIAAVLTILGYSVNDTIVIFDRVRENLLKTSGRFDEIVERSLHETMKRSINTSVTVLLSLAAIFFFGGETIKDFSLVLMLGVFVGGYSSIFIASPLLVSWYLRDRK